MPKNWFFWTVVSEIESPLDCKKTQLFNPKGNQSWIFIRRTDAEASIFWHLMWRTDSLEKTLMLGEIKGRGRSGRQRVRWLEGITDWMDLSLSDFPDSEEQGSLSCSVYEVVKSQTWVSGWTTTCIISCHLQTVTVLLFFQVGFLFYFFSSLIAITRTYKTLLNNTG